MMHTLKIRHKKTANYGIAVNQILFPLGNDSTNINLFFDLYNIYSNKHTKTEKIKAQINFPKTNKVSPKRSTRVKGLVNGVTNSKRVFVGFIGVFRGFKEASNSTHNKINSPKNQINSPKRKVNE
ncbi:hypothetical protein [Xanthomarina gelatinilytica]|uniref:hypothetical protein n=1 Tax=Xanthomarina gelatinilytica TaxID=1137281 RepID=UPI003AA7B92E